MARTLVRSGPETRTDPHTRQANEDRSEEHTSELQSLRHLVFPLLLEKKTAAAASAPAHTVRASGRTTLAARATRRRLPTRATIRHRRAQTPETPPVGR